jgi:hypothetical protein
MINYNLHVSGPRIRTLIALANGDYRHGDTFVVSRMEFEGLIEFKNVPGDVEGVTLSTPIITDKGQIVLGLIKTDVGVYLSRLNPKKR